MTDKNHQNLFQTMTLPCGAVLKNRIIKSAMSDSLGNGSGNPTDAQIRLYERWAEGGVAAMIIGEVQCSPDFAEKPGNLVLDSNADAEKFRQLAQRGAANGAQLWLQLGHAGAMAFPPISDPKGPSAIDIEGLSCKALTLQEVKSLPATFAQSALMAQNFGFTGVQIHAAHGFLLSQFLSPLFNKRTDDYGGSIKSRMRLLLEVIDAVRNAVGDKLVVAVKLNATDQLQGGLVEDDALEVVSALDKSSIDLIDISGGTYFPGAKSASDSSVSGPYFLDFSHRARARTAKPLMVTGGFKTRDQAVDALSSNSADVIGLARSLVLDPALCKHWQQNNHMDPVFPTFQSPPEGGITAWYTMRLTEIGHGRETDETPDLASSIQRYGDRDRKRTTLWNKRFRNRN